MFGKMGFFSMGIAAFYAAVVCSPSAAPAITFGEWAADRGYSPGDVMPDRVDASDASIHSLDGIGDYDWTTTPTERLCLDGNELQAIDVNEFRGLTDLRSLELGSNQISSIELG